MTNREVPGNQDQRQMIHDFIYSVFGDEAHLGSRDGDMNSLQLREKHSIPVGQPYEDGEGAIFQPHLSIVETITYYARPRNRRTPRIQLAGRLLVPYAARVHSSTETATPTTRNVNIFYFARNKSTARETNEYDGLEISLLADGLKSLQDPLLECKLLGESFEASVVDVDTRIETYKTELAGVSHPTDQKLLEGIAAHVVRFNTSGL